MVPVRPSPAPITSILRVRSVGFGTSPVLNESTIDAIFGDSPLFENHGEARDCRGGGNKVMMRVGRSHVSVNLSTVARPPCCQLDLSPSERNVFAIFV